MTRICSLTLGLCCLLLLAPQAHAQGLKFYYCYAPNLETGVVYVSETAPVGPVEERRQYGARFVEALVARGMVPSGTQAYCSMRASEAEIDRGKSDLRAGCSECGQANKFTNVAFAGSLPSGEPDGTGVTGDLAQSGFAATPEPGSRGPVMAANVLSGKRPSEVSPGKPEEVVPFEIAAPLPHSLFVQLIPRHEEAVVQIHYRFFACGDKIYVSSSLRAVPARGVNVIRMSAVVTGNFMKPFNFVQTVGMVDGHVLGCGSQKHEVASLSEFERRLVSGTFIDGKKVWSRQQMIEQLLGGFTMYAPAAPWPPGSQYADPSGGPN